MLADAATPGQGSKVSILRYASCAVLTFPSRLANITVKRPNLIVRIFMGAKPPLVIRYLFSIQLTQPTHQEWREVRSRLLRRMLIHVRLQFRVCLSPAVTCVPGSRPLPPVMGGQIICHSSVIQANRVLGKSTRPLAADRWNKPPFQAGDRPEFLASFLI